MGYALVTVLAVFLIACVAAAATTGSSLGSGPGNGLLGFANRFDLGESLQQASERASPQFVTVYSSARWEWRGGRLRHGHLKRARQFQLMRQPI